MTDHRTCKHCFVSGRVQGVFYRGSTAHKAQELKIEGYVRNLPDGRVEVLACGAPENVELLIQWLWIGPPAAKVTHVEIHDAPPFDGSGFKVLR